MKAIGVDIGGTSLRIGLVDETGELTSFERADQQEVLKNDSVTALGNFIEAYISRCGVNDRIAGLTVGLPATLDKQKSVVLNAPNISGFNGMDVRAVLQERFSFPAYLLKDVSALFYYDLERFSLANEEVVIACYIGTGIGNAVFLGGKLYDGANGAAGELGHIPIWNNSATCGCGNIGCSETVAGGKYLDRLRKEHFPDVEIQRMFELCGKHPALREYVRRVAAVVATEVNILDPSTVIMGGGVVSMDAFPRDELERDIRFYARKPQPEKNLKLLYSCNGGENGVIGAGLYAWKMIKGAPVQ